MISSASFVSWRGALPMVPYHHRLKRSLVEAMSAEPSFFQAEETTRGGRDQGAQQPRRLAAWAAAQSVPWLFMVTHEQLEPGVDAAATLDGCGLAVVMPMTGMRARTVAAAAAVPGLVLTVPRDDGGCAAILDVNALAYGMDLEAGKATIGARTFWQDQFPVSAWRAGSRSVAPRS